jgi:hypothetical protein
MNKTIWCFNDDEVGLSWWIDVVSRDPKEHMKGVWYRSYGGVGWMKKMKFHEVAAAQRWKWFFFIC